MLRYVTGGIVMLGVLCAPAFAQESPPLLPDLAPPPELAAIPVTPSDAPPPQASADILQDLPAMPLPPMPGDEPEPAAALVAEETTEKPAETSAETPAEPPATTEAKADPAPEMPAIPALEPLEATPAAPVTPAPTPEATVAAPPPLELPTDPGIAAPPFMAGPSETFTPLEPISPGTAPERAANGASLPPPEDDETAEFFQLGVQLPKDKPLTDAAVPPPPPLLVTDEAEEEEKPAPRKVAKRTQPVKRFNYKIQHLPGNIYADSYKTNNRHLPVRRTETDYDSLTFMAAAKNDLNGLQAMLRTGRDVNVRDGAGNTPLIAAASTGAVDVMRYLLARGADPQAANNNGRTAADYARARGDLQAVAALHEATR